MVKYFHDSIFVTIAGILIAYFWGEHVKPGGGLMAVFIACVLAILEISLSFDNAVVNAMKLKNMSIMSITIKIRLITLSIIGSICFFSVIFSLEISSMVMNGIILQ